MVGPGIVSRSSIDSTSHSSESSRNEKQSLSPRCTRCLSHAPRRSRYRRPRRGHDVSARPATPTTSLWVTARCCSCTSPRLAARPFAAHSRARMPTMSGSSSTTLPTSDSPFDRTNSGSCQPNGASGSAWSWVTFATDSTRGSDGHSATSRSSAIRSSGSFPSTTTTCTSDACGSDDFPSLGSDELAMPVRNRPASSARRSHWRTGSSGSGGLPSTMG